jgi:pimeloyl-ACP methyl ester carboxylesterase
MPSKRSESVSWSGLLLLAILVIARGQEDFMPVNNGLDEFWSSIGSTEPSNPYQKWRSRKRRSIGSKFHPPVQEGRMSIANMTCDFFEQPLNHFVPRGKSPTYRQRYCIYSDYAIDANSPIFFYTGNESPLEQYINHTGLMWELAPTFQARVIFVEHRYEGKSIPFLSSNCMSYASTIQALADYADILRLLNPGNKAAVIAFGGSYGGMLSGWFRLKYPHLVAGAIAASAPIGAFPQNAFTKIDWSARVVSNAMDLPYPPTKPSEEPNHCNNNLLAAWPLVTHLVECGHSSFLQAAFRLCERPTDASKLLEWAQTIWFDLAEGSFPYASSYIPFALLHKKADLPAWPLQAACWNTSNLYQDWGVQIDGNVSDVKYNITYGTSGLVLQVDWDHVSVVSSFTEEHISADVIVGLLTSVRDSVSIWYNVTKDVECYNVSQAAPNSKEITHKSNLRLSEADEQRLLAKGGPERDLDPAAQTCLKEIKTVGSWEPLCCNDEINLIITEAAGIGNDFFWPPSHPRGTKSYEDLVRNETAESCPDPDGVFGYSTEPYDLWSSWLDTFYGGVQMKGHSNIIFSNGLLDPWSAGGVYAPGMDPLDNPPYKGPMVQNITDSIIALLIEYGGHHTDLMYSDKDDPACVINARKIEKEHIAKWIAGWNLSN